jgi:type II secretory pathway component GspD/PulD (secretin)
MDLVVENRGEDVIIDGNPVPATTRREAQAEVAVRDGEIIILGGFINQITRSSDSGVPFLKDIPWLGKLFSRTRTSNEEIELIILIHPTVLETPELAAIHAENEKRTNLPGIQEAEREFQEAKRRQWNRIEAKKRKASGKRGKRELFLN